MDLPDTDGPASRLLVFACEAFNRPGKEFLIMTVGQYVSRRGARSYVAPSKDWKPIRGFSGEGLVWDFIDAINDL